MGVFHYWVNYFRIYLFKGKIPYNFFGSFKSEKKEMFKDLLTVLKFTIFLIF